jgi:hypothetical protein
VGVTPESDKNLDPFYFKSIKKTKTYWFFRLQRVNDDNAKIEKFYKKNFLKIVISEIISF